MFDLVLRTEGKHKMVYATSNAFRVIFLGIALPILVTVLIASKGFPFQHANIFVLVLCAVCLLSGLFLERWVFDKGSNLFEKHVGLIFLYWTGRRPLDALQRVVLG